MRYIAYRGEYGWVDQTLNTRLGSLTFSSQEAAMQYALVPNDARFRSEPINPRLIKAELQITNPVVFSIDDPFIEFSDVQAAVGREDALQIARAHSAWIESTDHWLTRYAPRYVSVQALLDSQPQALGDLYCQAYPLLDDPDCVALFLKNGFDGAVHGGNAQFSEHEEYRVFSPNQVTVLGVQRLGHMQSPRGTHRASCPG